MKLAEDLARFCGWKRIPFQKPNYRRVGRLPFIPLEVEVDQLIAGVGRKNATFLQLLKETGTRPGEAWNLRWTDIDTEQLTVSVLPEKNSNSRQLKVSDRLAAMLNSLPRRYEYVFRNPKIDSRVCDRTLLRSPRLLLSSLEDRQEARASTGTEVRISPSDDGEEQRVSA